MREHGQLWLPPLRGDRAVLELYWPESLRGLVPNFHLGTLSHGYKDWDGTAEPEATGDPAANDAANLASGSCNIDVNCPLGDDWQDETRGVVRLLINGSGLCSASLIDNTAGDCRPYVLTARHCISTLSAAAGTVFRFNYERPLCNSGTVTTNETVSGSTLIASYSASDVTLLELSSPPPESFGAYFNGWSRSPQPGQESTGIHHPGGDYKKISYNADPLIDGLNYGPDHWRITEWESGTTEGGSSGSPLFDQNHRIVGQLHGGTASCTSITYDEYGKFDVSWSGGGAPSSRLRDWLDPLGGGAVRSTDSITGSAWSLGRCSSTVRTCWRRPWATRTVPSIPASRSSCRSTPATSAICPPPASRGSSRRRRRWPRCSPRIPRGRTFPPTRPAAPRGRASWSSSTRPTPAASPSNWSWRCSRPGTAARGSWLRVPTGLPLMDEHFRDDMEAGANGWTSEPLIGEESWDATTADSFSPVQAWYVRSTLARRDTALVMPPLQDLPAGAVLTFAQRYDTEANRDGGVLEYSVDAGATWLDAGAMIVEGAYDSSVGSGESSPLAGRAVWSGDSGAGSRPASTSARSRARNCACGGDSRPTSSSRTTAGTWTTCWSTRRATPATVMTKCPGEAAEARRGCPLLDRPHPEGYELSWSAPHGGAAMGYVLYRAPLGATVTAPECEADLEAEARSCCPGARRLRLHRRGAQFTGRGLLRS